MAVEVLVRPAEALGIEPVGVGHRPDAAIEPVAAGVERRSQRLGRGAPASRRDRRSFQASMPSGGSGRHAPPGRCSSSAGAASSNQAARWPTWSATVQPGVVSAAVPAASGGAEDRRGRTRVTDASSAQNARLRRREVEARRLRRVAERVVLDLPRPERIGPRLEDAEVVEVVAVEDVVDPAPGRVAPDRRRVEPPGDREQRLAGGDEATPQLAGGEIGRSASRRLSLNGSKSPPSKSSSAGHSPVASARST